jgi:hypothetical protein
MTQLRCLMAVCIAGCLMVPAKAQQFEMPKPGPEHAKLKELEGTWDANVDFMGQKSKGTMTWKMEMSGFYLMSHFKGDLAPGTSFEGRGIDTYDPMKKKYVNVWCDTMAPGLMMMEGNFDSAAKKMTMTGEGLGQDGKPTKFKSVTEMKDKDTMVMTMSTAGPDGKDQTMLTISYKRRK